MIIGQITREYLPVRSGGYYIDYSYEYKGNKRRDSREISNVLNSPQRFVNKYFPVIVSDEGDESAILISPEDFAFFNKEFPDSLGWVVQWVKRK